MTLTRPNITATDHGFTLLDLLVVLVIFAAGASLAVPGVTKGWEVAQLRAVTTQLAATLKEARRTAHRSAQSQTVLIDVDHQRYVLPQGHNTVVLPRSIAIAVEQRRDDVRTAGIHAIRFGPDGSVHPARIDVRLGSRSAAVYIDGLTGRIDVEFGRRE